MLFDAEGNENIGKLLFERIAVVKKLYYVLSLNGFNFYSGNGGNVNALLNNALAADARIPAVRSIAESSAGHSRHSAESGVDKKL